MGIRLIGGIAPRDERARGQKEDGRPRRCVGGGGKGGGQYRRSSLIFSRRSRASEPQDLEWEPRVRRRQAICPAGIKEGCSPRRLRNIQLESFRKSFPPSSLANTPRVCPPLKEKRRRRRSSRMSGPPPPPPPLIEGKKKNFRQSWRASEKRDEFVVNGVTGAILLYRQGLQVPKLPVARGAADDR